MPERPYNVSVPKRIYPNLPETTKLRKDREIAPPSDAVPADSKVHLRWVRNTRQRRAEMSRGSGYQIATESDVTPDHGGYVDDHGEIVNGDLVLMKTDREFIEQKERTRLSELAGMDRKRDAADSAMGFEATGDHRPLSAPTQGPTFNIPIDLSTAPAMPTAPVVENLPPVPFETAKPEDFEPHNRVLPKAKKPTVRRRRTTRKDK